MDKLLLILTLLAGTAYAVVNPTGKTHNAGNTVVCEDGKRWTVCAPGNIPVVPGVIFETNFANDAAFDIGQQQASWTEIGANKPEGFNGALVEGANGRIYGVAGAGMNGTPALKMEWDHALGQPVTQLYLHLTGDKATGYDEVYVRYNLRLPNDIQISDPLLDDIPYWKFGRLWQNAGPTAGDAWTENRVDSGYVVWNFGGTATYGVMNKFTYSANTGSNLNQGSAGGERYSMDWYPHATGNPANKAAQPGFFNAVGAGAWDFNPTTRELTNNTSQTWHTLEWRFKLSTTATSNDGVVQVWFDGVEQTPPLNIGPGGGAPDLGADLLPNEIPTTTMGSGYNMLVLFDNMAYWNENWDTTGNGVFVSDVVVSTERIGHAYTAGAVQ